MRLPASLPVMEHQCGNRGTDVSPWLLCLSPLEDASPPPQGPAYQHNPRINWIASLLHFGFYSDLMISCMDLEYVPFPATVDDDGEQRPFSRNSACAERRYTFTETPFL